MARKFETKLREMQLLEGSIFWQQEKESRQT